MPAKKRTNIPKLLMENVVISILRSNELVVRCGIHRNLFLDNPFSKYIKTQYRFSDACLKRKYISGPLINNVVIFKHRSNKLG